MPITKATQSVITPNIVTTDTRQTITGEKVIESLYDTTSTTTLLVGTGTKTLTVGTGLSWVENRAVRIRNSTSSINSMEGLVTSYNPVTGVMVANITTTGGGSATLSSWNVTQLSSTALPALRITSNNIGNAFVVEDSTNPDSTPLVITSTGQLLNGTTIYPSTLLSGNVREYVNGGTANNFTSLINTLTGTGASALGPTTRYNGLVNNCAEYNYRVARSFTASTDTPINIDIISEFESLSTILADGIINNYQYSCGIEVKIIVNTQQTNATTNAQVWQRGAYSGYVVPGIYGSNNWLGSDFIGYTANSLSTTQPGTGTTTQVNFTTAAGIAPTLGGAPATGFASIIAVRETASANGSLTLQLRPHTTANTATLTYSSTIVVYLKVLASAGTYA